jgi:hypothetical protein
VDPGQVVGQPGQARVAAQRGRAAHLPGARYFEQPGDHLLWLGDTDAMFGQIREFLGEAPGTTKTDRRSSSPAAPAAG